LIILYFRVEIIIQHHKLSQKFRLTTQVAQYEFNELMRINEFWLKTFTEKFESKALIHSQSDTFPIIGLVF
jgi:hypothetical protein